MSKRSLGPSRRSKLTQGFGNITAQKFETHLFQSGASRAEIAMLTNRFIQECLKGSFSTQGDYVFFLSKHIKDWGVREKMRGLFFRDFHKSSIAKPKPKDWDPYKKANEELDRQVRERELARLNTRRDKTRVINVSPKPIIEEVRETVPIIFVPGIMGSNLQFDDDGLLWATDNYADMANWIFMQAGEMGERMNCDNSASIWSNPTPGFDDDQLEKVADKLYLNPLAPFNPITGTAYLASRKSKRYLLELLGRSILPEFHLTEKELSQGWGEVASSHYYSFLKKLEEQSFFDLDTPVYAIGYDWRQCNRDSGERVANGIKDILETRSADNFLLVTHSMGGICARAGLKDNSELADKALGVVHIAQPALGAPIFAQRMHMGANKIETDKTITWLLGNTKKEFQMVSSGIRGALQLVVNARTQDWYTYTTFEEDRTKQHAWRGNPFDFYQMSDSPPGFLSKEGHKGFIPEPFRSRHIENMEKSRQFHNWLGSWYASKKTWSIVGTGGANELEDGEQIKTCTRVHFNLPPKEVELEIYGGGVACLYAMKDGEKKFVEPDEAYPLYDGLRPRLDLDAGDGTVPTWSAVSLPEEPSPLVPHGFLCHEKDYQKYYTFEVRGYDHGQICNSKETQRRTIEIFRHALSKLDSCK